MAEEDCSNINKDRELPAPAGLPAGWKCIEKRYLTGPQAGQPYVRFTGGPDFKHKGVLSVRAAIRKDAEDRGLDPDEEVAKHDRAKVEKAEALAKAKEEAGRLAGTKREEAVNRFREKFGTLDGPTVAALPGWRCEVTHSVSSHQTHVTYVDPEDVRYVSVKDIECCLGHRMTNNLDDIVTLVKTARAKASPSLLARSKNEARQSAYAQGTMALADVFSRSTAKANSPGGGSSPASKTSEEGKSEQPGLPSTPPTRSTGSSAGNACGESAEKTVTPSPVPSSAAARKLGAGGCDATAADAGTCEVPKACPSCSTALEWTDFAEGAYVGAEGWQCDQFERCGLDSSKTGSWWRWLCRKCEADYCQQCFQGLPCQGAKAARKRPNASGAAKSTPNRKKAPEGIQATLLAAAGVKSQAAPKADEQKDGEAEADKKALATEGKKEAAVEGEQTPADEKKKRVAGAAKQPFRVEEKTGSANKDKHTSAAAKKKEDITADKQPPAAAEKKGTVSKDKQTSAAEEKKGAASKDKQTSAPEEKKGIASKDKQTPAAERKTGEAAVDKQLSKKEEKKGAATKDKQAAASEAKTAAADKQASATEQKKDAAAKDKQANTTDKKKVAVAIDKEAKDAESNSAAAPPAATKRYRVDNSELKAKTAGLGFRRSKRLDDKDGEVAEWDIVVEGSDEGDGWLRVGSRFLPTTNDGISVLSLVPEVKRVRKLGKQRDPNWESAAKGSAQAEPDAAAGTVDADAKEQPQAKRRKQAGATAPCNGYMVFCLRERQNVISECPAMDQREIVKELGRRWRTLAEEERSKCNAEADRSKAASSGGRGGSKASKTSKPRGRPKTKAAEAPGGACTARLKLKSLKSLRRLTKRLAKKATPDDEAGVGKQKLKGRGPGRPPSKRRKLSDDASSGTTAAATAGGAGGVGEEAAGGKVWIEDDAPADSPAHQKVKWDPHSSAFWFEMKRGGSAERVRVQTTVVAAGSCRESAARIARLCYVECEAGADKDQVLQLRSELYKKCGAPPIPRKGPNAKDRNEVYRNLFGEVVVVNTPAGAPRALLKAFADLELSDVDLLTSEDINSYEKELGLSSRRSQAERLARLEQMAQRTTLPLWASGGSHGSGSRAPAASGPSGDAADAAAGADAGSGGADALSQLTDMFLQGDASQNAEYDAKFLQVFLALPPEERQHASLTEITRLERVAHIADGGSYTIAERRSRLKEKLWESRTSSATPKNAGYFKSWLKPAAEESSGAASACPSQSLPVEGSPAATSAASAKDSNKDVQESESPASV